jgi:excisionase family DNA binding protein
MSKTMFTVAEAAGLLNCHAETLRRAIHDGFLRAARLGREYRLSRSDLQAFWSARGGGQLFAFGMPEEEGEPAGAERETGQNHEEKRLAEAKKQRKGAPASSVKQLSLIVPPGREP